MLLLLTTNIFADTIISSKRLDHHFSRFNLRSQEERTEYENDTDTKAAHHFTGRCHHRHCVRQTGGSGCHEPDAGRHAVWREFSMSKTKKKGRGMFVFICILAFLVSFAGSAAFKVFYKSPALTKYTVNWSDEIGKAYTDFSYGE